MTPDVFSVPQNHKALLLCSIFTNYETKTPAPLFDPPPSLSLEGAAD